MERDVLLCGGIVGQLSTVGISTSPSRSLLPRPSFHSSGRRTGTARRFFAGEIQVLIAVFHPLNARTSDTRELTMTSGNGDGRVLGVHPTVRLDVCLSLMNPYFNPGGPVMLASISRAIKRPVSFEAMRSIQALPRGNEDDECAGRF